MSIYHIPTPEELKYWSSKNFRMIQPDEVVIDVDDRKLGKAHFLAIAQMFIMKGYRIEVYYATGQKSPHGHIKEIPEIAGLTYEQNKKYKELLLRKAYSSAKLFYEIDNLVMPDLSLCGRHAIAEEHKKHYKYGTVKKLIGVSNEEVTGQPLEEEILSEVLNEAPKPKFNTNNTLASKINAKYSIVRMAKDFGLAVDSRGKALCPFHNDSRTPSLSINESKGIFHCFGCGQSGNIIVFYALLKRINSKFKMEVSQ